MAYDPANDLLALLRQTAGGMRTERMPGLDYLVAGLARAGMFLLSVGQTPPTEDQVNTVWLRPAQPSWAAEGTVFLYNSVTGEYELATPALWGTLFASPIAAHFQSVTTGVAVVADLTTVLVIQRANPATTVLTLPSALSARAAPIQFADWSTAVVNHQITLTALVGETVMQRSTFLLFSSADQLAGITLYPVRQLNGWIIAP